MVNLRQPLQFENFPSLAVTIFRYLMKIDRASPQHSANRKNLDSKTTDAEDSVSSVRVVLKKWLVIRFVGVCRFIFIRAQYRSIFLLFRSKHFFVCYLIIRFDFNTRHIHYTRLACTVQSQLDVTQIQINKSKTYKKRACEFASRNTQYSHCTNT